MCTQTPKMMLLIGICISLTKNPMNPIRQKPTSVARAIFANSKEHKVNNKKINRQKLLQTFLIRLGTTLNQAVTILSKLLDRSRINDGVDGVHV